MKLRLTEVVFVLFPLFGCTTPSASSDQPVLGYFDELSYNAKCSLNECSRYVLIRPALTGTLTTSSEEVRITIKSSVDFKNYPVLSCSGEQKRQIYENVIDIPLTCANGSFGTAFVNLVHDKDDLGQGQFSVSNSYMIGTFEFGEKLLLNFQGAHG